MPSLGTVPPMMAGASTASYTNAFASVALSPSGFVTVTPTIPAACAGASALITSALLRVTPVAAVSPNCTAAPVTKPAPTSVTAVPPSSAPPTAAVS